MKRGPLCQSYRLDVGIDRQEILQPLVTAGAFSLDAMTHLDHTQIPLRHGIVERRPSDSITAVGIRSAFVQNLQRCACAAILCFETRRHLCGFDVPIERRLMKRRLIAPVGPQRHIDAKPHRFTAEDGRTSRFLQATVSGSWRTSQEKRWSCLCETPVTVCVRKFTIRRIVDGERGRKRRDRIIPQLAFCCILQASVFLRLKAVESHLPPLLR